MSSQPTLPVSIAHPGQGRVVHAFGEEAIFHLTGEQTGGKLTVWTNITPPGGGPPPHYHLNEDEWLLVQEGRVSFFDGKDWHEVATGGGVFAPKSTVHTFKNVGDTPCRMLVMTWPSGFEKFFARCAEEFAKAGGPDMERIGQIAGEHGIHFVQP
ncbi:MAG: cupin domain-containing protein [Verrucomicrobiia bacterium]